MRRSVADRTRDRRIRRLVAGERTLVTGKGWPRKELICELATSRVG